MARDGDAKQAADAAKIAMARKPIRINGHEVGAACETSPSRRAALKGFFDARDIIQSLNPGTPFDICSRSLEIRTASGGHRLGWWRRDFLDRQWSEPAATATGINIPRRMDKDDREEAKEGAEHEEHNPDEEAKQEPNEAGDAEMGDKKDDEESEKPEDIPAAQENRTPLADVTNKQKAKGDSQLGAKKPRPLMPNASCPTEGSGADAASSS